MKNNLKILILEDNESDADLLQSELKKGGFRFTPKIVQSREAFENALQNFNPDIILSDYSLPSFDGVTAFGIKNKKYPDIPFIMVSGTLGEETAVELIKIGITDYTLKDKLFTLPPKIKRALKEKKDKQQNDIIEQKKEQADKNLRKSELRFRDFFENAPEAILILDVNSSKFIKYNAVALSLLKYSGSDLLKKGPKGVSPALQFDGLKSAEKFLEFINNTLKGDKPVFEWLLQDASGKKIMSEVRLVSLTNDSEPQLLASFVDITDRKAAEEKLIKHIRILSEIAFLQSHQVRAPIAQILGLYSIFKFDNPSDPLNSEILFRLKAAVETLDGIIHVIVQKTDEIEKSCAPDS